MEAFMLTEVDREYLTEEILKECWHEWVFHPGDLQGPREYPAWICSGCAKERYGRHNKPPKKNRTFTTPTNFFALWQAAQKMPWWDEFMEWACDECDKTIGDLCPPVCKLTTNLVDPVRFPEALCRFRERGEKV